MVDAAVAVNVYCDWAADPKAYRIYVDGDLLTERTYIWQNSSQYVQENIVIQVEPGIHTLNITPVDPTFTGFYWSNLIVNRQAQDLVNNQFIVN
jgi:hypothetical protein